VFAPLTLSARPSRGVLNPVLSALRSENLSPGFWFSLTTFGNIRGFVLISKKVINRIIKGKAVKEALEALLVII